MALVVKNLLASAGDIKDTGSIPVWGWSPGGGHGNPLQYSCLENLIDRGSHRVIGSIGSHRVIHDSKNLACTYLCKSVLPWLVMVKARSVGTDSRTWWVTISPRLSFFWIPGFSRLLYPLGFTISSKPHTQSMLHFWVFCCCWLVGWLSFSLV